MADAKIKQDTNIPDEETQEILDEMENSKKAKEEAAAKEKETDDDGKEKEAAKAKEEAEAEAKKKEEDEAEAKEKEEKEDKKEDDGKEEKEEEEKPSRSIKSMPLKKFKKYEEKWKTKEAELESKILELSKGQAKGKDNQGIKELAEETGMDESVLEKIVNMAGSRNKLPEGLLEKIDKIGKQNEDERESLLFNKEFDSLVKDFPEAKEIKDKLKDVAYTEGYEKVSLRMLYLGSEFKENPKKKTAEGSKGGSKRGGEVLDFDNLTPEQIKGLSDENFDKYSDYMEKKSKPTIIRH